MRWTLATVGECLAKVTRPGKLQTTDYQEAGHFPIIDQGEGEIAGYTDCSEVVIQGPLPLVVFGDHTRRVKLAKEPFACGADGTQLLFPNRSDLDPTFFFYVVKSIDLSNYFYARHFKFLKEQKFSFPGLSTQYRIASILSAYDDLIENNRRRMALLEDAARQLYREWFVRLRFPGHERAKIKNGLPEGWERKTLGEVAEVNRASLSNSFDGEIEYIDIASVSPGSIDSVSQHVFHSAPSRARRIVVHGDIIWSCVRPNRRSYAVIWKPTENLIVSTGFAVITPRILPTSYLLQATTTDAFVGYLDNHARGAAYPAVLARDFERAYILAPRTSIVSAFDEITEPMLAQSHALRLQNQKLRTARDLLLPKLMSEELAV